MTQPTLISDETWRNPARDKILDLWKKLEQRAHTDRPMQNFSLAREDLADINLVKRASKHGYQLTNSDLYHTNLENAHLFMLDLSGSSLMKANLTNANLH